MTNLLARNGAGSPLAEAQGDQGNAAWCEAAVKTYGSG